MHRRWPRAQSPDHDDIRETDADKLQFFASEPALFAVLNTLGEASVDVYERKILWPDGARLSIEETARRIHCDSGQPLDMVESHVVGWLEMTYEPTGLDDSQMEEFENLIEQWIAPYEDTP